MRAGRKMYQNKYLAKILFSALFVFAFVCPGYTFCESGADNTAKYALKDGKCMAYYCKAVNEPYWLGGGGNNCEGMCSSSGEKLPCCALLFIKPMLERFKL